ncbi:hypothetical protein A3B48_03290 [Candidatus Gottesmanbacteria bacterium RIFCSPLOWO2_01_FULL_40_10]|nr:MAG: hypothetical protein A3B48_03290 [Candidatus Gottesmanbacteria bacterium RIFCSPLOWO2_01_FULL_40_10]
MAATARHRQFISLSYLFLTYFYLRQCYFNFKILMKIRYFRFLFPLSLFLSLFFFLSPLQIKAGWINPREISIEHPSHPFPINIPDLPDFPFKKVTTGNHPSFPACPDPGGEIIADYEEGTHAIVGDDALHTGSDTVYSLGNGKFVQCFCPDEGKKGIQTNWIAVAGLTDQLKQLMIQSGWFFIEKGADWGLADESYLAKNSGFYCKNKSYHSSFIPPINFSR